MKHMKGNQRPVATMSHQPNVQLLPSARIRCDTGRIRVGDRTFVSASDALSAYMQQFDGKQQRQRSPGRSPSRSTPASTSVDAAHYKGIQARSNSPVARGRSSDPANVTGLLTSSPNPADILGSRLMANGRISPAHSQLSTSFSAGYSSSRLLNGEEPTQSSKHSVSFSAVPDSTDISQYNSKHLLSFDSNTGHSSNSPRHNSAIVRGSLHQNGSFNGSASFKTQHTPSSHSISLHHSTSSSSALPQRALTTSNGVSHTNRLLSRPSQTGNEKELSPKSNGVVHTNGYLDIADVRRDALPPSLAVGGKRPKSEVEVLLTAMPSQQELERVAQDTMREVKLKRLLKEANSLQPSSLSPSSSDSQQLSPRPSSMMNSSLPSKLQDSSVSNLKDFSDSRLPQPSSDNTLPHTTGKILQRSSSTSSNKSSLQQEVEDALSRSAQLLETIKTDTLVSPRCVSDVGSLNTDVLLSIDPYRPAQAASTVVETSREGRSRHRYSYHTPGHQPRSLSVGRASHTAEQRSLRDTGRRRSVDSLGPPGSFSEDKVFQDLNQSVSLLSDSEDILKRLQSPKAPSTPEQTGNSNQRSVRQSGPPSWIQELIPATPTKRTNGKGSGHLEDSIFTDRGISGGRQAPSWVNGLENSDIASSMDLSFSAGARTQPGVTVTDRADESNVTDLSYAGPGLNYSDLITSPSKHKVSFSDDPEAKPGRKRPGKVSRNNSFSGVSSIRNNAGLRRDVDRSKPPVTISKFHQDLAGVDVSGPKSNQASSPASLSSSLRADNLTSSILRKKVCEDSVDAKQSMDKYFASLDGELTKNGRPGQDGLGRVPRCSSMDSVNRIGHHGSVPSDITWASPITKDSNLSSKWCQDDPTLTPAKHTKSLGPAGRTSAKGDAPLTVDTDQDLLEGDRPWEAMLPSFKSPVQVGATSPGKPQIVRSRPETPTLSGGHQPGSMEALKQMLFRLQTEETSFTASPSSDPHQQENGETTELIPALKDYDFEVEPGGQSLERALVHLGRLKTLVQTGTSAPQTSSPQPQDQAN